MAGDDADRVLVVGAGPVGVLAATFLAREGIPVTLIEASREIARDLRASTFHPPTLDMLKPLGIVEALIERGLVCPTWQFRDRREGVVATFDLGVLAEDTDFPYRLQCEQWKLTELLRGVLDASPAVTVVYEASAVDMRQDETGVTLTIERPDGAREDFKGRYLVGADGARSAIRKLLAVEFRRADDPRNLSHHVDDARVHGRDQGSGADRLHHRSDGMGGAAADTIAVARAAADRSDALRRRDDAPGGA